eukprot:1820600-Prymnesium_polylepis.1
MRWCSATRSTRSSTRSTMRAPRHRPRSRCCEGDTLGGGRSSASSTSALPSSREAREAGAGAARL